MAEHKNKTRAPLRPLDAPTLLLSVGGLGFLRPAPGTWGSLPPVVLAGVMILAGVDWRAHQLVLALVLLTSSIACVACGGYAERRFGRKDAPEVVADETAGQCLPLLLWPSAAHEDMTTALIALGAAFVLFRAFDVVKPWPARRLERLPRGWGVLVDDLMAGVYAAALAQLGARIFF